MVRHRFNSPHKWLWECPRDECDGRSRKPNSHYKALRQGRIHLKSIHHDYETAPRLKQLKTEK